MDITIAPLVIDIKEVAHTLFCLFLPVLFGLWFWRLNKSEQAHLHHREPDSSKQCETCPFRRISEVAPENGANGKKADTAGNTDGNSR